MLVWFGPEPLQNCRTSHPEWVFSNKTTDFLTASCLQMVSNSRSLVRCWFDPGGPVLTRSQNHTEVLLDPLINRSRCSVPEQQDQQGAAHAHQNPQNPGSVLFAGEMVEVFKMKRFSSRLKISRTTAFLRTSGSDPLFICQFLTDGRPLEFVLSSENWIRSGKYWSKPNACCPSGPFTPSWFSVTAHWEVRSSNTESLI